MASMEIKYCDRCHEEIRSTQEESAALSTYRPHGILAHRRYYDLCKKCAKELREWLHNPITVCLNRNNQGEENEEA